MATERRRTAGGMRTGSRRGAGAVVASLVSAWAPLLGPSAIAQSAPPTGPAPEPAPRAPSPVAQFEGRPITEVIVEGLKDVDEQLVRNQLRTRAGQPFDEQAARDDEKTIYRLGRFRSIDVVAEPDGPGVRVRFVLGETPMVQDVQVVGNRHIADQDISERVKTLAGAPLDDYTLGRDVRAIEELYRNKGYYLVGVTVDERELENGIVLFRVREGTRVKVTDIRFEGNRAFKAKEIRPVLKTRTAGILEKGPVDDEVLDRDVSAVIKFYRDRGYLDARVGRTITPSPDGKEAVVTFVVDEGPLYTLRRVRARNAAGDEPLHFSEEQLAGLMDLKPGDVFAATRMDRSVELVRGAYWKLGYIDANARAEELRDPEAGAGVVDVLLVIFEGTPAVAGEVVIQGNDITRQKVVRRDVQVRPGRPLDRAEVDETRERLEISGLFARGGAPNEDPPKVTIQPPDPANPGVRDVLVEVTETNTGSLAFGAAIGSDSGVIGSITLTQRNFDLLDYPESFDELVRGQAFRGGGQQFSIAIQPGTEIQTYSLDFSEPRVFDSDYSAGGSVYFRIREYDEYDETRYGGRARVARAFGDRWSAGLTFRNEWIELDDIDPSAPVDLFAVADKNLLVGFGVSAARTTVPPAERLRPTRGSRFEVGVEQVGAYGDFTFTKMTASHQVWFALYEDFLGRKGVLSFSTRVGYIPQDAPTYERFYMGGRSMRGFDFRTVSPKGIRNDTGTLGTDPVGGRWMFFLGAEYEHPVWEDLFSVVFFTDTGTVTNNPGFSQYRIGVGAGIRLYIKQLGAAPLAFDFAYPVKRESGDEEQVFSFSLDIPF